MSNLILLSGGMDSTLCLQQNGAALCLFVNYGQRSSHQEHEFAVSIAGHYGAQLLTKDIPNLDLVNVVACGRNAVLLSLGAAVAQSRSIDTVIIGCNAGDAERFPDCRPPFIQSMDAALSAAYGVRVIAPMIAMSKKEIVAAASAAGIPQTWTCYTPTTSGDQCGECYACTTMANAT